MMVRARSGCAWQTCAPLSCDLDFADSRLARQPRARAWRHVHRHCNKGLGIFASVFFFVFAQGSVLVMRFL